MWSVYKCSACDCNLRREVISINGKAFCTICNAEKLSRAQKQFTQKKSWLYENWKLNYLSKINHDWNSIWRNSF